MFRNKLRRNFTDDNKNTMAVVVTVAGAVVVAVVAVTVLWKQVFGLSNNYWQHAFILCLISFIQSKFNMILRWNSHVTIDLRQLRYFGTLEVKIVLLWFYSCRLFRVHTFMHNEWATILSIGIINTTSKRC